MQERQAAPPALTWLFRPGNPTAQLYSRPNGGAVRRSARWRDGPRVTEAAQEAATAAVCIGPRLAVSGGLGIIMMGIPKL
jgi:hypothetical protein